MLIDQKQLENVSKLKEHTVDFTFCLCKLVIYDGTKDLKLKICPDYIMGTVILLKLIMFTFEYYGLLVCDCIDGLMPIFLKNVPLFNQGRYGKWRWHFSRNLRSLPINSTTRHHYAEEGNLHAHRHENLKPHIVIIRVFLFLKALYRPTCAVHHIYQSGSGTFPHPPSISAFPFHHHFSSAV